MYKPATKAYWKGRVDTQDGAMGLRWHQVVQLLDLAGEIRPVREGGLAFAFLGFCCDEGVRRNQGRVGAAAGPAALRGAMASFAYHLPEHLSLHDAGDIICTNQHLEEAQELLGKKISLLQQHGYRTLVLGGGHEIAYGHFLGLEQVAAQKRLGILNFDAHFDLRSYAQQASSGTPFLQIANSLQAKGHSFNYYVLGIQEQGNTRALFQTAEKLGVRYTLAEDVHNRNMPVLQQELQAFLEKADAVYVTIDMDAFSAAIAPGVSAVNALGLQPDIVLRLMQQIVQSGKLLSLDVAELNPGTDVDNRTAKLGAGLLYHIVKTWSQVLS